MLRIRARPLRRGLLTVAMTAGVVAASAGSAVADTVTVSPAGAITGSGNVTFGDGLVSVGCSLQFTGTLVRTAIGTLGRVDPGNPQIGTITSATASRCALGATFDFLDVQWTSRLYARQGTPTHTRFWRYGNVDVLVTGAFGLIRCLYDLELFTIENVATGVQTVDRLAINSADVLPPSTQCFVEPWLQGSFELAPGQTIG